MGQIPLEGEVFEVGMGHEQRQGSGTLVHLATLDSDPAVLDHVNPAPPVGADDLGHLPNQFVQGQRPPVNGDR
jgi:hypothetical protein